MPTRSFAAFAILAASIGPLSAASDRYNITAAEHLACGNDAMMLCSGSQDEDQLVACMRANRPMLSQICLITFNAGLKKRHMPL